MKVRIVPTQKSIAPLSRSLGSNAWIFKIQRLELISKISIQKMNQSKTLNFKMFYYELPKKKAHLPHMISGVFFEPKLGRFSMPW